MARSHPFSVQHQVLRTKRNPRPSHSPTHLTGQSFYCIHTNNQLVHVFFFVCRSRPASSKIFFPFTDALASGIRPAAACKHTPHFTPFGPGGAFQKSGSARVHYIAPRLARLERLDPGTPLVPCPCLADSRGGACASAPAQCLAHKNLLSSSVFFSGRDNDNNNKPPAGNRETDRLAKADDRIRKACLYMTHYGRTRSWRKQPTKIQDSSLPSSQASTLNATPHSSRR